MKSISFFTNLKNFFFKLKKIFNSKILFSRIKKADILFWGTPGYINVLNENKYKLINPNKANAIKVWGENYHFLILLKCLLKLKFSFIDYTNEFIKVAEPKIIISFLDNYRSFYLLKKSVNQKKILLQNAFRSGENNAFKLNQSYKQYKVDYLFCHNIEIKKKYEELLGSKVFCTGSFLSNNCPIIKSKKKYDILYISTFRKVDKDNLIRNGKITLNDYLDAEKNLVKNIYEFSKKYKKKLSILCTIKVDLKSHEKEFFYKILGKNKNWEFIDRKPGDYKSGYKILDQANVVTGIDSTLLYESFGRGNKTIFFDIRPSNKNLDATRHFAWPKKFPKSGPFWISSNKFNKIENILKKNINLNNNKWKKIKKKYADSLMQYDKNNKTFYRVVKNCLKV